MSHPIRCSICGDVVGVSTAMTFGKSLKSYAPCPGKGNHTKPQRIETFKGFLWWKRKIITVAYPETRTFSKWEERA